MEMCPGGTSISEFPKGIAANLTSCPRLADERAQNGRKVMATWLASSGLPQDQQEAVRAQVS